MTYNHFMRKISRRLFLLTLLTACAPLPYNRMANQATSSPWPTFPPLPTPADFPNYSLHVEDTEDAASQLPTPIPINVVVTATDSSCRTPIIAPTSAPLPSASGVDPTTGRNVMGRPQVIDPASYRLAVTGLVDHPLNLTIDDLRCMPKITETVTTTCYNFQDTATWSGVMLREVLQKAGVRPDARKIIQTGADGAKASVSLDMALDGHNFLAYQMGDKEIPILFGFPVRSIVINVAGQYSIKWLRILEVV